VKATALQLALTLGLSGIRIGARADCKRRKT
jgi:hypothetical protein